jgi:hypothetical protein
VPAYAAQKGASQTAMEKASDEAIFHRVGDWFATRGKSPEEAKAIKAERKAQRAAKRAQKEADRAKKEAEKQAKRAQKEMKKQQKQMKSKWGK